MKYRKIFWGIFALSIVLFFAPISTTDSTGLGLDKLFHLLLLGLLGALAYRSYPRKKMTSFILLLIYIAAVEYIQGYFLPWRSLDVFDAVAGALGLIAISFIKHD